MTGTYNVDGKGNNRTTSQQHYDPAVENMVLLSRYEMQQAGHQLSICVNSTFVNNSKLF